jgi:uncharacterized membrane protein
LIAGLELFNRFGFAGAMRWLHVLFGIAWIGLLYYFNFVQVPAFGELSPSARNEAITKLATRALWWFRYAALGTAIFGILIIGATNDYFTNMQNGSKTAILIGILLAMTMLYNVWMVIWPNQKIVIANAANVIAGGQPDPAAATAQRKAFLASRQNVVYSVAMLFFMVGTSHFYTVFGNPGAGKAWAFAIIAIVIWGVLEANALGFIQGTGPGRYKWPYETVTNVIISAFVLWAVLWILSEILLKQ